MTMVNGGASGARPSAENKKPKRSTRLIISGLHGPLVHSSPSAPGRVKQRGEAQHPLPRRTPAHNNMQSIGNPLTLEIPQERGAFEVFYGTTEARFMTSSHLDTS
jgi:hypothetical protein